jgi:hypothetical protein
MGELRKITLEELEIILTEHQLWLDTGGKKKANAPTLVAPTSERPILKRPTSSGPNFIRPT